MTKKTNYIIYDGECGFCNKTVMMIAKNDKNNYFTFVSSLSEFGADLISKNKIIGLEKTTIILIDNQKIYTKSLAIRNILLKIPSYRIVGYLMFLFPQKISDYVYDFVSKNRKRILKNKPCEIPNSDIQEKFIL